MRTTVVTVFVALSMLAFAASATEKAATAQGVAEEDALAVGIDAYIYGYPLVTMELTRRVSTNVAAPEARKAPMGRFAKARTCPDASYKTVTAPNADTLYTQAWIDVSQEPWIVGIPDLNGRYALFPFLDGWTEVFEVPGKRTTGTGAQTYAITGPGWSGTLPEGVTEYKSPTGIVWLLGRIYCTGTPEDYAAVHALQDEMTLVPLSSYGKPYAPAPGNVDPAIDGKTAIRDQIHAMDAGAYFKLLAELLKTNPPTPADAPMVAKLATIGIVPGQAFDPSRLDPAVAKGLARVPKPAQERIMGWFTAGIAAGDNELINGWTFTTKTGVYGTNYIQRALVTAIGLGANRPLDAIYPTSEADAEGQPYSGAHRFRMHFEPGAMPPAEAFWSLTFGGNPMNPIEQAVAALCLGIMAASPLTAAADETPWLGPVEAIKIATEAYIYGYPLVTFDMARRQQTNVAVPDAEHAPMGQMIRMRTYPAVDNHCCAAPNADTLYTEAWLDVTDEPWILSIPDMGDRYYIAPMLDGWSEVIEVAGTYTTGGKAQTYAITGPGWSGTLPEGVKQVESPTGMVWVLGRVYSTGTPEDYKAVHALQDQFSVVPLSAYGKPYTPPPGVVDPGFDMKTSVRKQVNGLDANAYFERLAELMKTNPPTPQDAPMVAQMAKIGLIPGQAFDPSKLNFMDREAIRLVPKLAVLEMGIHLKRQKTTNGWLYFTNGVGDFGTDYLLRGMANLLGPGWNRPRDAVYPLSQKDANGDDYDGGKHRYVMRFEKGQLPPAAAFWSLTLYDSDFFFVPNPIDRYDLAQRNPLVTNADGSVDLYIQASSPGKDKEANWLPAPKGKFVLVMRIYAPKETPPSILDGTWTPPPVKPVD